MTKEEADELFTYSDGFLYRKKNGGGHRAGTMVGWLTACNGKPYWKANVYGKTMYVHRIVFLLHHGYLPKIIDHIDGDSTNNRIENLREATQHQNCANAILSRANTSGYKGVTFDKRRKRWIAQVHVHGKNKNLGCFKDIEDAAAAYAKASALYFGEFARPENASNRNQDRVMR